MFFGAGNIVFPLIIGHYAGSMVWYALGGFLVAAVGIPFIGLLVTIEYEGNYRAFFDRLGAFPGFIAILFLMCIIGPLVAIPRCIALSHGTLELYLPHLTLRDFSILSSIALFFSCVRENKVVGLLGRYLSPLKLFALGAVVVKGVFSHPAYTAAAHSLTSSISDMAIYGLHKGYNTMDLIGAFFFAGITVKSLRAEGGGASRQSALRAAIIASCIGALLLAIVYIGFGVVASYYAPQLSIASKATLLGSLSQNVLGGTGGIIVSSMIALACLTTEIALATVFAHFLSHDVTGGRICYTTALIITVAASCFFANFGFDAILTAAEPILIIGYPALLVLTLCNGLNAWYGFKPVKLPVALTLACGIYWHFFS